MNLLNKKIFITGGSGGIGSILCKRLLQTGSGVTVIDRSPPETIGVDYIMGDLSNLEGIKAVCKNLESCEVDILINLAGMQYFGLFEEQSADNLTLNYFVNLIAPSLLIKSVLPQMKKRNSGQIVNIGSIFASINFAHFASYSSSKSGLKSLSESLRRELSDYQISITYIAPRAVKTPLNSGKVLELANKTNMNMDLPELVVEKIINSIAEDKKDVYIGFPESFFVRVNALFPRIVDVALAKNDRIARSIIKSTN